MPLGEVPCKRTNKKINKIKKEQRFAAGRTITYLQEEQIECDLTLFAFGGKVEYLMVALSTSKNEVVCV